MRDGTLYGGCHYLVCVCVCVQACVRVCMRGFLKRVCDMGWKSYLRWEKYEIGDQIQLKKKTLKLDCNRELLTRLIHSNLFLNPFVHSTNASRTVVESICFSISTCCTIFPTLHFWDIVPLNMANRVQFRTHCNKQFSLAITAFLCV